MNLPKIKDKASSCSSENIFGSRLAAHSHSSKSEGRGFTMSDENNRISPKFPSNSTEQRTSNGTKSLGLRLNNTNSGASDIQQLFYSDVRGYIPAAGIGIAN